MDVFPTPGGPSTTHTMMVTPTNPAFMASSRSRLDDSEMKLLCKQTKDRKLQLELERLARVIAHKHARGKVISHVCLSSVIGNKIEI